MSSIKEDSRWDKDTMKGTLCGIVTALISEDKSGDGEKFGETLHCK